MINRRFRAYVYPARDGWRWHIKSVNGNVVADSGEAYQTRWGCYMAYLRLRNWFSGN
jgi:uncharacterized protein YegP (UPF0339 family)